MPQGAPVVSGASASLQTSAFVPPAGRVTNVLAGRRVGGSGAGVLRPVATGPSIDGVVVAPLMAPPSLRGTVRVLPEPSVLPVLSNAWSDEGTSSSPGGSVRSGSAGHERTAARQPLPPKRVATPVDVDQLIWVPVDDLTAGDVPDADLIPWVEMHTVTGRVVRKPRAQAPRKVSINGEELVLIKYCGEWFAIGNVCPHNGAALEAGDIEDLEGEPSLRCPRHKWRFSLRSGRGLLPSSARDLCLDRKPVRTDASGRIYVGFDSVNVVFDDDF
ncbi:uncharacterized protein AMSG_09895 [Thecamonas trahens ATCC 50062]|uniref:Rieske domain-containing protein n=1 Tax=Thecamonas trahens ATCC 50062 TaxID=461836 RepID=A0A0L0DPD7_THETB|nr:hypothetical protein AMSG_09895 [Thecamonas trahens ATCC 50062]KNC54120.1 hypothetical protein AMSG_09895 [Thecamonas trahens ATCC 50062]|eukprot:XP_013753942.1 hypothetical protein AMSG_09895 [Thecamonas trahens ATCC 50062]